MDIPPKAKRILIVDDEPDVVRYLEMLLQDQGYETFCASDGREALELARRERPDLVTLDISMPSVSGTKVYREIRGDSESASIPVIIITAIVGFDGDPYAYMNFISHRRKVPPPEGFFPKPIDVEAFLAKVRDLLGEPVSHRLRSIPHLSCEGQEIPEPGIPCWHVRTEIPERTNWQ